MTRLHTRLICLTLLLAFGLPALAQISIPMERRRMKDILATVSSELENNFYDPKLRGMDWKALRNQTAARIDKAESVGEMLTAIFWFVDQLQDSHTKFLPPGRVEKPLFGFQAKPFGEEIRIYELETDGAAAAAGLKLGDRILQINGYNAKRESWGLLMLFLRVLRPVAVMQVIYSRDEKAPQAVVVKANFKKRPLVTDLTDDLNIWELIREGESQNETYRHQRFSGNIGYLHLPSFTASERFMKGLMNRLKGSKVVIVDLRGNPGGALDVLADVTGHFEPEPATIADLVGRKKTEQVKTRRQNPTFEVPLIIMVDSDTGSAAEMFARHFQRTGRAVVIGDRTPGRVTASRFFRQSYGLDTVVFYGIQIGMARVVLPGGEELEGKGITPDVSCIPTEAELREERDRCLFVALNAARKSIGLEESDSVEIEEDSGSGPPGS